MQFFSPFSSTRSFLTHSCHGFPPFPQVLEQLLEENDQDPNVWLLLALCYQGGGDLEAALEAGQRPGGRAQPTPWHVDPEPSLTQTSLPVHYDSPLRPPAPPPQALLLE